MEPSIAEFGDLAYAIDILILSESGGLLVGCEVKKDDREHNKLLLGFEHCCTRGPHSKDECLHPTNHAKYTICVKHRPKYFVASSPQLETIYKLTYSGDQVFLEPIPSFDQLSMYLNLSAA